MLSEQAANTAADAVCGTLNGGALRILDISGMILAELGYGSPAFGSASKGKATANAIKPENEAPVRGKPSSFVAVTADGVEVFTGEVGKELTLNVPTILKHSEVRVTSHTYTQKTED